MHIGVQKNQNERKVFGEERGSLADHFALHGRTGEVGMPLLCCRAAVADALGEKDEAMRLAQASEREWRRWIEKHLGVCEVARKDAPVFPSEEVER